MVPFSRVRFRRLHSREEKTCPTGDPEDVKGISGTPETWTKSLVLRARSGEVSVARYITVRTGHFKEVCMGHVIEGHFGEVYCAVNALQHLDTMLLYCPSYVWLMMQWSLVVMFHFEAVLQSV